MTGGYLNMLLVIRRGMNSLVAIVSIKSVADKLSST